MLTKQDIIDLEIAKELKSSNLWEWWQNIWDTKDSEFIGTQYNALKCGTSGEDIQFDSNKALVDNVARGVLVGVAVGGRMDLAGKNHPGSGVKFDSKGFPIFEAKYSMKLKPEDYMKSRATHFDRASKALYNNIMNNSRLRSQFTESEIAIFKQGGVPKAYTWHHHQDVGVMQLVDREIHRKAGHTGGFSIWGPGN